MPKFLPLSVVVNGDLSVESNIDEYKKAYLENIKAMDRNLSTDQDFVDAMADVKLLQESEKKIDAMIDDILSKARDVYEIREALLDLREQSAESRKSLKRQIEAKKSERKGEIKTSALAEIATTVNVLQEDWPIIKNNDLGLRAPARIDEAMHNLRSFDSMVEKVEHVKEVILSEILSYRNQFEDNKKLIDGIDKRYIAAFQDSGRLMMFDPEKLAMEISTRIARCEAEEAKLKLEEKEKAGLQEQMAAIKEPDTPPVEEPAPVEEPPTPTPVEPDTPPSEDRELLVIVRFYGPIEKARALQMLLDPDQLKEAFKDYSPASNILSGIVGKPFLTSPEKLKQRYLNDQ